MLHFLLKEQHRSGGCTGVGRGVAIRMVVSLLRSLEQKALNSFGPVNHGESKREGLGMEKY